MKQEKLIFFTESQHRRPATLSESLCRLLLALTLAVTTYGAGAAEETVLLITGDRIPVLSPVDDSLPPGQRIDRYYVLLDDSLAAEATATLADLAGLVKNFDVAFAAADTAEVNNVISDIARRWAMLRTLHARYFSPAAIAELEGAYRALFPILDEDG